MAALEGFPVLGNENNDLTAAIQQTTARLQQELGGQLPAATISDHVGAALDEFRDAHVKYIPVLTYRIARERLHQLLDVQRSN